MVDIPIADTTVVTMDPARRVIGRDAAPDKRRPRVGPDVSQPGR